MSRCTLSLNSNESNCCAFAVHADMTAVELQLAEQGLDRLVRVLITLLNCTNQLVQQKPWVAEKVQHKAEPSFTVLHSVSSMSERGATPFSMSQNIDRGQGSTHSGSSSSTSIWLQCTLPSLTFSLLSNRRQLYSTVLEECSLAYDSQATYTKVSLRVRGFSSRAEDQNDAGVWTQQSRPELIISCNKELFPQLSAYIPESQQEEVLSEEFDADHQSFSTGFFNLVVTNAEVGNVHKKLKVATTGEFNDSQQRFLSEIDVEVFPLDVFVTTDCINLFISCTLPFLDIANSIPGNSSPGTLYTNLNNNVLPLLYFKSKRFRMFIHHPTTSPAEDVSTEQVNRSPDLFMFELESTRITLQLENPLSRILVNESLYYSAAEAGLLEIPGSSVEDRQYELLVSGITLLTGSCQVKELPTL